MIYVWSTLLEEKQHLITRIMEECYNLDDDFQYELYQTLKAYIKGIDEVLDLIEDKVFI